MEDCFLSRNKLLEEKVDHCIHLIETKLDRLFDNRISYDRNEKSNKSYLNSRAANPFSSSSFTQFKSPYIRDFRNFSGPTNNDVKQIRELTGTENIDSLLKHKNWSIEARSQLKDSVLDYYANVHIIDLLKQKNILHKQLQDASLQQRVDLEQKLSLIEEQTEQVKSRKEERIFVPEDRFDPNIDWCAISAKLSNTSHDAQDCRLMWSNKIHWTINNGDWTKEEDVCLLSAVQKYGRNDWDKVAKELNSNRLPWQCCSRYHQEVTNSLCGPSPIDLEDSDKIIEVINLCRIGNFVPWNQVMYFIQYHSLVQVKYQWHKLLSERKSNQPWSHHEDVLLLQAVEKFGDKNWNRISSHITGRSNKSCRERYIMRLKYEKRSIGNWRQKEDERLNSLVGLYGTNWSLIASYFPDRNNHQIRNRYELLRKEGTKVGPIKHRKVVRNAEGFFVNLIGRRHKPTSEREVDRKLSEILTTYQTVKHSAKSLVCRGTQDEVIYQNLIQVVRSLMVGKSFSPNLTSVTIERAIKRRIVSKYELFSPNVSSLKGYKAWTLLQDHLNRLGTTNIDLDAIASTPEYHQILKIVISLFLWPAILSRIRPPELDFSKILTVGSIIEKETKNLYRIRELQRQLTSSEI